MNKIMAYMLILASTVTFCFAGYKTFLALTHPLKYKNEITAYCKEYNLSASLVSSLINVESSYDANAKSNKNAIGLMQIKLSTANYLNSINKLQPVDESFLYVAKNNIKYGCIYLRYLINKFENDFTAIAAYNAGETVVRSWLKNKDYSQNQKTLNHIPYLETENYVNKIKNNLKFYRNYYKN